MGSDRHMTNSAAAVITSEGLDTAPTAALVDFFGKLVSDDHDQACLKEEVSAAKIIFPHNCMQQSTLCLIDSLITFRSNVCYMISYAAQKIEVSSTDDAPQNAAWMHAAYTWYLALLLARSAPLACLYNKL